jgi:hypothetical protein
VIAGARDDDVRHPWRIMSSDAETREVSCGEPTQDAELLAPETEFTYRALAVAEPFAVAEVKRFPPEPLWVAAGEDRRPLSEPIPCRQARPCRRHRRPTPRRGDSDRGRARPEERPSNVVTRVNSRMEQYVIAARLKPGKTLEAEQMLATGPPFDPSDAGLVSRRLRHIRRRLPAVRWRSRAHDRAPGRT